jgi:hypothetical protein
MKGKLGKNTKAATLKKDTSTTVMAPKGIKPTPMPSRKGGTTMVHKKGK